MDLRLCRARDARDDATVVTEWRKSPSISCQWRFTRSVDARVREFCASKLRVDRLAGQNYRQPKVTSNVTSRDRQDSSRIARLSVCVDVARRKFGYC